MILLEIYHYSDVFTQQNVSNIMTCDIHKHLDLSFSRLNNNNNYRIGFLQNIE